MKDDDPNNYVLISPPLARPMLSMHKATVHQYLELDPEDQYRFQRSISANFYGSRASTSMIDIEADHKVLVVKHQFIDADPGHVLVAIERELPARPRSSGKARLVPLIGLALTAIGVVVTIMTAMKHWEPPPDTLAGQRVERTSTTHLPKPMRRA